MNSRACAQLDLRAVEGPLSQQWLRMALMAVSFI
jgi:hypothetical protein